MPRRRKTNADIHDSDASFSSDDVCYDSDDTFDAKEHDGGSDTDATDVEDEDCDVEDQIQLFNEDTYSSEYWRRKVESFNEDVYACQDYSLGTTVLLDAVADQWRQFSLVLKRDVADCYATISVGLLYSFFDWVLCQKVGKNGRRKRGIKKKSSLGTYWKVFRLVFERAVGDKVDPKLNRSMHRAGISYRDVLRDLAKKHGLSEQRRANRGMTIDDLKQQIETTLGTTRKSFKLGELRILAVLFLLLLAPAGSRPEATLKLQFKDIKVSLARDPEGGPHRLLLRLTPEFTKTYLGEKEHKTYTIPETIFDPSLLLSPHVFLLGILFRHQAFRAPSLTSPHHLSKLDIHNGEKELPLPFKEEVSDTFIFRRAIDTMAGYQISLDERISAGMMNGWTKRIGEILGFNYPTTAYTLRYNAANAFDQSVDVSEALRNLAMGHSNSDPFQKHYLGRNISADLWGILRGQKPQQALMKQSCSIGHSISKRRPIDLTPEQSDSVTEHPTVVRLTRALERLPRRSKQSKQTRQAIRKEKERLRRELKQKIRQEWTDKQAIDDIERQIKGVGFAKIATGGTSRPQGQAQKRLLTKLTAPVVNTLEGQYRRRDDAIAAVSAYCLVQEGCTSRQPQHRPTKGKIPPTSGHPREGSPVYQAALSVFVADKHERPRRCFICIGQAFHLPPDHEQRSDDLIREFYTSNDLTKHVRRMHLSKIADHDQVECKVCDMTLDRKMHFQRHALEIHGTVS
ncbi:hypothetical protein CGCA056_v007802 [Colletotrichum aenigma]|uniref:uncharacterized protein n=1 Tax=Colletotrichum aenigma TaxID=1215731 RepID=UPI00187234EA|nr:uncharacterized protein CGCA056_v007802 [Colletotrichum aenigma]KAF5520978.1 hypothetical protein CGCA056_v007802 [Colletotrichum aenigma]